MGSKQFTTKLARELETHLENSKLLEHVRHVEAAGTHPTSKPHSLVIHLNPNLTRDTRREIALAIRAFLTGKRFPSLHVREKDETTRMHGTTVYVAPRFIEVIAHPRTRPAKIDSREFKARFGEPEKFGGFFHR